VPRADGTIRFAILGDARNLQNTIQGLGKNFAFLKTRLAVAGIGIAAAGAAAGVALFKVGEKFDEAFDKIRIGTGATGPALDRLKASFKKVVSDVPTDFGSASEAIAGLNTMLGLTGRPLERLSAQVLELSRLTGTDVKSNVEAVSRLFGDWSVATKDQSAALDKLWRASQATGIGVQDLAQLMTQFGAPMRQLGFDFDTSAALLSKWHREGVNVSTVLSGLRQGLKNFAKAGKEPAAALLETIEAIKAAGSQAEATGIAMKVFGARAGADMAAAIREGRFELGPLLDTIKNGSDTIRKAGRDTEDLSEKWTRFKNQALVAIEPVASRVFDGVGKALDALGPALQRGMKEGPKFAKSIGAGFSSGKKAVVDWARTTFASGTEAGQIVRTIGQVFLGLGKVMARVGELLVTVAQRAWAVLRAIWDRGGRQILEGLKAVGRGLLQVIKGVMQVILGIVQVVLAILTGRWGAAWKGIQQILRGVWNVILGHLRIVFGILRTIFGAALGLLQTMWRGAWNAVLGVLRAVWNGIQSAVSGALNFIRSVISGALSFIQGLWSNAWQGLRNVVTSVWNGITGAVSWAVAAVRNIISSLAGKIGEVAGSIFNAAKNIGQKIWDGIVGTVSGIGEKIREIISKALDLAKGPINRIIRTINRIPFVPNIPELAQGGIVTRPTLALIGEAGPEAVVPLRRGRALGLGGDVHLHTTVNVQGGVWNAEEMRRILDQRDRALMRNLRELSLDGVW